MVKKVNVTELGYLEIFCRNRASSLSDLSIGKRLSPEITPVKKKKNSENGEFKWLKFCLLADCMTK